MAARLATEEGITAYRQCGHIAETPHGHIKHNMRFRQLTMRGKAQSRRRMGLRRHRRTTSSKPSRQPSHPRSPGQPGYPGPPDPGPAQASHHRRGTLPHGSDPAQPADPAKRIRNSPWSSTDR